MWSGEILRRLHLQETRGGATEFRCGVAGRVELVRRAVSRTDELRAMLIKSVDQQHEAARHIALLGPEAGHAGEDDAVIVRGDGEIVGGSQRRAAERIEGEAG